MTKPKRQTTAQILANHEIEDIRRFDELKVVLYGDEKTGEKGMKQKVDELHELLVQAKGIKSFFGWIVLIGSMFGAWTAIKIFFLK